MSATRELTTVDAVQQMTEQLLLPDMPTGTSTRVHKMHYRTPGVDGSGDGDDLTMGDLEASVSLEVEYVHTDGPEVDSPEGDTACGRVNTSDEHRCDKPAGSGLPGLTDATFVTSVEIGRNDVPPRAPSPAPRLSDLPQGENFMSTCHTWTFARESDHPPCARPTAPCDEWGVLSKYTSVSRYRAESPCQQNQLKVAPRALGPPDEAALEPDWEWCHISSVLWTPRTSLIQ